MRAVMWVLSTSFPMTKVNSNLVTWVKRSILAMTARITSDDSWELRRLALTQTVMAVEMSMPSLQMKVPNKQKRRAGCFWSSVKAWLVKILILSKRETELLLLFSSPFSKSSFCYISLS